MPVAPSMRRRRLAAELRKLREGAGLSAADACRALGWNASRLSRIETRQSGVNRQDLRKMLEAYGVEDREYLDYLAGLAGKVNERGWWQKYSGTIVPEYGDLISLEEEARTIRNYEQELVPGLLQTPEYARAYLRAASPGATAREIERRVEVRTERQEILTRHDPPPPLLNVVLSEAVLRRPVGGNEVMRGQIEHLLCPRDRANITVQVLPFSAGVHPGMTAPFAMLAFPDEDDLGIVNVENATGALFLEEPSEIRTYNEIWNALQAAALSPEDSQAFLKSTSFGYRQ